MAIPIGMLDSNHRAFQTGKETPRGEMPRTLLRDMRDGPKILIAETVIIYVTSQAHRAVRPYE
jgi:hypothetical protein